MRVGEGVLSTAERRNRATESIVTGATSESALYRWRWCCSWRVIFACKTDRLTLRARMHHRNIARRDDLHRGAGSQNRQLDTRVSG